MAIFDKEAKGYDQWYSSKLGNFVDEVERICAFELFKVKEGMTVLDIGCGTGNYSIQLAEMGCKVVGIDISNEMLTIAKRKAKENNLDITFYNMDVYNLDFPDGYFDAAFSMAAFEFIKNEQSAMEEIFRVVRDRGEVLVGTISKESTWGQLYQSEAFQKDTVFKYADFKTLEDLTKINEEMVVAAKECLFIPPSSKEEDIDMAKEMAFSKTEKGGFICVLWKK